MHPMVLVLQLDEYLREINNLCDHSYLFVDENTLLMIYKVNENRKALIGTDAGMNQKIKSMYELCDAKLCESRFLVISIHFSLKQICLAAFSVWRMSFVKLVLLSSRKLSTNEYWNCYLDQELLTKMNMRSRAAPHFGVTSVKLCLLPRHQCISLEKTND
jgi:hypothetical protein